MKAVFRVLLLVGMIESIAFSEEVKDGSLSVLVFSEGKPLISNEIKIDNTTILKTDKDGAVKTRLPVGTHQLEIFGKDQKGVNLGYFKKQVRIERGKDTEVIASLSQSGPDSIDIDMPVVTVAKESIEVSKTTGTGKLHGKVLSSQGGKPIEGARVFVRGTSVDARTDAKGGFSVTVPAGKSLSISVVHSAYAAQTVGGIKVKADGSVSRTIRLTPASMELEEFVVLAPKVEGSITELIHEEKNTNAIANIIGAEAFSKKGDSSAAAALKRASGVTLVSGDVYVRGLGDRYGNIEMNSMTLPSPNPLKRLVPLDIFPASVIGSMKIQKSGEPNIPANFGGGYVNIRTKQSVTEDYIKLSLSTGGNSDTGNSVITQNGDPKDWRGYDRGYWAKPSTSLSNSDFIAAYQKRDITTPSKALPMNFGAKIEAAKSYTIEDDHTISLFGSYKYNQKHQAKKLEQFTVNMSRDSLGIDFTTSPPTEIFGPYFSKKLTQKTTESSSSTYSHGGVFDLGYSFLDVFKLNYTKLYTHEGVKSTSLRVEDDLAGSDVTRYTTTLRWIEKTLHVDQLNGAFAYELYGHDASFDFGMQKATAHYSNPNTLQYIFEDCPEHLRGTPQCTTGKKLPSITNNLQFRDEASEDVMRSIYLKTNLEVTEEVHVELGFSQHKKSRKFASDPGRLVTQGSTRESNASNILRDENGDYIGDIESLLDTHGDNLVFEEAPLNNSANIKASVKHRSSYLKYLLKPLKELEIIAGVRHDTFKQKTQTIDPEKPTNNTEDEIMLDKYFPSVSVRYKPHEDHHLDVAVSKTYIMPDLVEFANAVIVAPTEKRIDITGNTELQPTFISNYDLKYSRYFGENDYAKVGVFYKDMKNAIEDAQAKSASDEVLKYTFINAQRATIRGVEFDTRIGLSHLSERFASFYLSGNYTYLDSKVTLNEAQQKKYTSNNRQLQGLSRRIMNIAIEYETERRSIVLAYNKMGERIRRIGFRDSASDKFGQPDSYEIPPQILDLVWKEKFENGLDLRFKIGNILDEEVIWYQYGGSLAKGDGVSRDFARANFITDRYKRGKTFSFEVSYKY